MFKKQRKKLSLKKAYYISFFTFIVIPILIVLFIALLILNKQFKSQAIENIGRIQENVATELISDVDVMSMRLSHLIYTNNNEILSYAAKTDDSDWNARYENEQKLQQTGNLALEPVKNIISASFYMKGGRSTYIKNEVNRSTEEIRQMEWYQKALERTNTVVLGSYDTKDSNDLYTGGRKDMLVLVFALAPDVMTDRSQKIEMVVFYQSTDAAEKIKEYNKGYLAGKNKFGIMQITDEEGQLLFSTMEESKTSFDTAEYTCIRTPVELNDTVWHIESYVRTRELTMEYWKSALFVFVAAVLIFILAGNYSSYFLHSIVKPVEEISAGLKQVEEGNLDIHITASGQSEIRNMIHQFNAMVRRLKALIGEYEQKVRDVELKPEDYFAALIKKEMTPKEVYEKSREFFAEKYTMLKFHFEGYNQSDMEGETVTRLLASFERNPRFASRCTVCVEPMDGFYALYRITEDGFEHNIIRMIEELQRTAEKEFELKMAVCIGTEAFGWETFENQIEELRRKLCLRHLYGENVIVNLNEHAEQKESILLMEKEYEKLAGALYIADEKNMTEEKEKLLDSFANHSMGENRIHVLAAILAIANRFSNDNCNFADVFGQKYNYMEKMERVEDVRSLRLWLTNYFAWIMDYSASKLNVSETDVIIKAKRYIADHYEDAELSLSKVAEYVDLNEKYFTNRFTKETGETFSSYLTGFRMQKAKELLRTTTFKVYEISEMVGYHNVEHFNRMFKKLNGITPAQFRKTM